MYMYNAVQYIHIVLLNKNFSSCLSKFNSSGINTNSMYTTMRKLWPMSTICMPESSWLMTPNSLSFAGFSLWKH